MNDSQPTEPRRVDASAVLPGLQLEPRLPPSRRHPDGAARCQAIVRHDQGPRQCKRKARDGFPTCSHHGAGFRKREQEGARTNPALVNLRHGGRAQPATVNQLFCDHPELQALYEQHLHDEQLLDMRPVLARVKALGDWIVSRSAESAVADPAFASHAIQSLRQVLSAAHELLRIEEKLGPITHGELRRLVNGFAQTIRTFVPPERHEDALAYFRQRAAQGD